MLQVILTASRALAANDPETLEKMAAELSSASHRIDDLAAVQRAATALSAQADAAAAHLALRARVLAATETYQAVPWKR